jgi:predicted Zn-dependent peptidase
VERKKVAALVQTGQDFPGERYPPLLVIAAAPRHPHTSDQVLNAIEEELARLIKEPVAPWELEKVHASVDVGLLNTLQTNSGMATTLAYNQTVFGDWRYLLRFQERIHDVTPQDVQAFARKYLTDDNKTIAVLEPLKK